MIFFQILANIIFPVFALIAMGYVLRRALCIDTRSVSRTVLYILSPCLIFNSIVTSELSNADLGVIAAFSIVNAMLVWLLAAIVARLMRLGQTEENAFYLATIFVNSGNLGMSLNLFAFGQPGLNRAVVFFLGRTVLVNTLGVYLASRGRAGVRESLINVLRVPLPYVLVAALLIRGTGITVPAPIMKPVALAGAAAVPVLLLVLGMELSQTRLNREFNMVGAATAVRLVGAPLIAVLMVPVFGVTGLTRAVCIVESATPTAVFTIVMAKEFGTDPEFVTSTVFVTTMLSAVTLTILLALLM